MHYIFQQKYISQHNATLNGILHRVGWIQKMILKMFKKTKLCKTCLLSFFLFNIKFWNMTHTKADIRNSKIIIPMSVE